MELGRCFCRLLVKDFLVFPSEPALSHSDIPGVGLMQGVTSCSPSRLKGGELVDPPPRSGHLFLSTIGIASKSKLNEMGSHAVIEPSLRGVPFVVV